jgi:hypothetical protein
MARELPNVYQIASTSAWTPARWQKQRICSRPVMLA